MILLCDVASVAAKYTILSAAVWAALLVSVSCGIVGSYVVTRRITYVAGSIAHTILGGIGAARFCQEVWGWTWFTPVLGAVVTAISAAVIIGLVRSKSKQREDTIIAALWALGMSMGILFMYSTPGYAEDLMSYLFGNILMITSDDLWMIVLLDGIILIGVVIFYNPILAICFDEEFALTRGIPVQLYYVVLLCATALTVVLLSFVVGVVMVVALLSIPAAIAGEFCKKLWQMMTFATLLTAIFILSGLFFSYRWDIPTGATTIVIAGFSYLAVIVADRIVTRLRMRG
ncbi:MAG: metal ABC transporter permease [Syntrophales bacterium]|nr:metal ABC transporter permease [Syntrophales bacterium]